MAGFDTVDYETTCPRCHRTVRGFQTYDGPGYYEPIDLASVNSMHGSCKCGAWLEIRRDQNGVFQVTMEGPP